MAVAGFAKKIHCTLLDKTPAMFLISILELGLLIRIGIMGIILNRTNKKKCDKKIE